MARSAELPVQERPRSAKSAEVHRLRRRPQAQYYAFLSYSHRDEELADWLHRELEDFHVPPALAGKLTRNGVVPKRLAPIFRDEHELAAADDLGEEIEEAIASSQFLIVLCSPDAARSHWTNAEIELFKKSRPEGCILAAIASGEPFASEIPGREHEECFPPALRRRYDRRGRPTNKRAEPLAADLREEGQSRWIGLMKLVAGMLGVGLDELVQRETTRRHKRMAWITAASVAGMLFTSALAFTAIRSRDEAREQRRQAEGLVEFMVGDLRDKLEPLGQLSALDGVGSRVLAYYRKQDTSQLSDAALLQRSRALSLMADVAYQSGKLDEAQNLYRQAMAGTAEALRRSPDDPRRLYDHAQNVFWIGEVARWSGDPNAAAAGYGEYRRLAYRLAALDPDNLKYRMEVHYGDENVGISLLNQRKYGAAAKQFEASFGPIEKLASLDPANLVYQREVGTILSWMAEAQRAQGNYDDAIAARRRQLAHVEGLLNNGATDVQLMRQAAVAHMSLGLMLSDLGGPTKGEPDLQTAVNNADRLMAIEPRNAIWKLTAAMTRLNYGRLLLAAGNLDQARSQWAIGCRLAAGLKISGAGMAGARTVSTDCLTIQSRLDLASGATAAASTTAERALASAKSERNEDPLTDRCRVAAAYLLVGDALAKTGDSAAANAAWSAGLRQIPQGVAERPQEMNTHAELLQRLGRGVDARPMTARLAAIGYKRLT